MINFKGIKQLTKQAFLDLSDEDKKGYFCLVRDGECETDGSLKDENVTNEEIYFGGRKYAETSHRKMFIGTQEEYDLAFAAGDISTGALVIITDESGNIGMRVSSDAVYAKDFVSGEHVLSQKLSLTQQYLSDEQKKQVIDNIGSISFEQVSKIYDELLEKIENNKVSNIYCGTF